MADTPNKPADWLAAHGMTTVEVRDMLLRWKREIQKELADQYDAILADMCKDSHAYKTGYDKGARSLRQMIDLRLRSLLMTLSNSLNNAETAQARKLIELLSQIVNDSFKELPRPDPDSEGFKDPL